MGIDVVNGTHRLSFVVSSTTCHFTSNGDDRRILPNETLEALLDITHKECSSLGNQLGDIFDRHDIEMCSS